MVRLKTGKEGKTINFDEPVLRHLEDYCKKEKLNISIYVNDLVKMATMSQYEFYRQMAKKSAADLAEYRQLMDTAPDKPEVRK
jgi:hypothetical protein